MAERQFSVEDLPGRRSGPPPLFRSQRKPQVSVEMRVFRGVIYALLAFSFLSTVGYALRGLLAAVLVRQVQQQAMSQVGAMSRQVDAHDRAWPAQRLLQQPRTQQQLAYERSRYVLAANQRCVDGAVIQVQGTTYTQIGSISWPVHCDGRVADRPLR